MNKQAQTLQNKHSSQVVQNAYFEAFVPVYSIAMEIILMQIILDETPAIFAVEINEETNQTKVFADQAKTQELTYGEAQECEALSLARENFAKKASYVGITQNDKIQLKDYILNSVIGEDIIGGIYDNIIIGGENKTYSLILDEILNINPFQADENVSGDESQNVKKSIFEPYPLSIVEDLGEKLYTAPAGDMLSHITAREYQSVLVMPSKTNNGFYGFGLALESEYDITIRVSVNYYNSASKKSTIVGQNVVSVKAGKFDAMNMVIINASTNYKVSSLNLSDLSATQPKEINNISGLSEYYDVYDNGWGGIGKLNSDKIGANYFEILLEVQKKLDRDYYPFKFGIVF